ncbi:BTAD domain-containing putative transcriptional regulator [Nonomuraea sp. B5E05]|uniref:BTAD domain-containing putative transcriptional regulator n=1 Tax=Nonomuraea sp. B5E05 TaxID=3153569 RepID=UPI0032602E13
MRFGVLGRVQVWTTEGKSVPIPETKVRALLANLLVHQGRPASADRLIDDLWGDELPANPTSTLQLKISRLRQTLERAEPGGGRLVVSHPPGYLLTLQAGQSDADTFTDLITRAQHIRDPQIRADTLAEALALWHGPAYADFADDDFARSAARHLEEQRLTAQEARAEARLELGEHALLIGELGDLVAQHPLREGLRSIQIRALYRAGRQSEALASFSELCEQLAEELGLDPSPELIALQQAILRQEAALLPPTRGVPIQRITTIRSDTTSFVGRLGEIAKLRALLGETRVVTLTGPGGVGKTRLAIHVARGLKRQYPGGIWLVELADVKDGHHLASTVAASVRMPDISTRDPVAALVDYLADHRLLIILDNCEHLVEDCAALVSTLIGAAFQLRILVTSREPLGILGERIWPVPPLTTPGEGIPANRGGREYEAVALFRERAEAVGVTVGQSEAVGRLCRRLDGLPLAIELAVPWLRTLTVEELADRLDDRFALLERRHRDGVPRHRALRAAVDWSYDLCTERERVLWARLSVFAGGVSLEAAEAVCVDDYLTSDDILLGLAGLVDKSLVAREESDVDSRYVMLETIRQYGRDRLAGQADAVRRRHRDYYLQLAEAGARGWWGPHQRALLDRVRAERANISLALDYCATPSQARTGMRLAGALWWWWITRDLREGRRWLERLLRLDAAPSRERALALWVRGMIAADQGDAVETLTVAHEGVEVARAVGDTRSEAHNIHWVGMALWMQGKLPEAAAELERALRHYQHTDEQAAISMNVPSELGMILALLGDTRRGIELCEQSVAACGKVDERWTAGWSEWNLAVASWADGNRVATCAHTLRFLQYKRDLDDYFGIPFGLELAAWCAAADGDAERAATLLGASDKMWEPVGAPLFSWHALCDWSAGCRIRAREIITDQAFQRAYQRGQKLSVEGAVAYALNETSAVRGDADTRPDTDAAAAPVLRLLTPREEQVARLIADGRTNRQIAAQLVISERTVGGHIEHIMTKLDVASRTQIAVLVLKGSE